MAPQTSLKRLFKTTTWVAALACLLASTAYAIPRQPGGGSTPPGGGGGQRSGPRPHAGGGGGPVRPPVTGGGGGGGDVAAPGTCAAPIRLELGRRRTGRTEGDSVYQGTCAGASSPESVFQVRIARAGDYMVRGSFQFDGTLYMRSSCEGAHSELACNDDFGSTRESLLFVHLQPGTYFLFADGASSQRGTFDVEVRAANVEELRRSCSRGDADDCLWAGELVCSDVLGAPNPTEAASLFESGCPAFGRTTAETGPTCDRIGALLEAGTCGDADIRAAVRYFDRGCRADHAFSCFRMGNVSAYGLAGPEDEAGAVPYFQRGCDLGSDEACTSLGVFYLDGRGVGVDQPRARQLFERACSHHHPNGCLQLGYTLVDGEGGPVDARRALAVFTEACDRGNGEACNQAGLTVSGSRGIPLDGIRRQHFYERACELGFGWGCHNIGIVISNDGNWTAAIPHFRDGCDMDIGDSCGMLAQAYRDGTGVPVDATLAGEFAERGCALDSEEACAVAGSLASSGAIALDEIVPSMGAFSIGPNFSPDPARFQVPLGEQARHPAPADCAGHIDTPPDFVFDVTSPPPQLIFFADSDVDATLVVRTPSGRFECNDDHHGLNPLVSIAGGTAGRYLVWVGTFSSEDTGTATFTVTARPDLAPPM